ncbi:hypothetical protein [Thermogemmatispora sp.]|uniref:hypothetical protein n=1 Tax=Thermogemmatispora sp. TaxID=1968838 RepID=UPI0035E45936
MKKSPKRRARNTAFITIFAIAGIIVVAVGAALCSNWSSSSPANASSKANTDPRFLSLTVGTSPATEVPDSLPPGGVTINEQFVLKPLSPSVQSHLALIAQSDAITIGRRYVNTQPSAAKALLASFTSIHSVLPAGAREASHPIQNVPAWIVTFTTTNPENVVQGKRVQPGQQVPTLFPTHLNIVVNATTGDFVLGFFTV